jgi:hypothetical protein
LGRSRGDPRVDSMIQALCLRAEHPICERASWELKSAVRLRYEGKDSSPQYPSLVYGLCKLSQGRMRTKWGGGISNSPKVGGVGRSVEVALILSITHVYDGLYADSTLARTARQGDIQVRIAINSKTGNDSRKASKYR